MASWWRFMRPESMSAPALAELSQARGRLMREAGRGAAGSMAALLAGPDDVERLIREVPGVQAANWNGPRQTVIAGPSAAVKQALDLAAARGISGRMLPVSSAFHTPLVAPAREPLALLAGRLLVESPDRPVYSNLDASPHPADPAAIAARLGDHLAGPVRFAEMIEAMHRDGARVFVEVGPGSILTPLIDAILKDRAHLAVACDPAGSSGLAGWLRAIARLVAAGLPLDLETLTRGRSRARARFGALAGRRKRGAPVSLHLACQWQPGTPLERTRARAAGPGTARPSNSRRRRESPFPPMALTERRPSPMVLREHQANDEVPRHAAR